MTRRHRLPKRQAPKTLPSLPAAEGRRGLGRWGGRNFGPWTNGYGTICAAFVISFISAQFPRRMAFLAALVALSCGQAAPVPATPVGVGPQPTATYPGGSRPGSLAVGPVSPETGKQLFVTKGCVACHTVSAVPGAVGETGPRLDGVGDPSKRPRIADGRGQPCPGCPSSAGIENSAQEIKRWISNPPAVKPGTAMPNLNLATREVDSLVAFLQTLK